MTNKKHPTTLNYLHKFLIIHNKMNFKRYRQKIEKLIIGFEVYIHLILFNMEQFAE